MKFLKVAQQTLAVLTEIILHRSRCPKCLFIACLKGFSGTLVLRTFRTPQVVQVFSFNGINDIYIYIYYTHVILLLRPIIDPGNL